MFAARAPVAVGLNVMLITQLAPGFSVAVQVVDDIEKSPAEDIPNADAPANRKISDLQNSKQAGGGGRSPK